MSYELFQQGPEVYIPVILVSLIITLGAYCAFPLIFARLRKKSITKRNYRVLCYCINFVVMVMFIALNGRSSGGPYFLWTWVFSATGIRTLENRGILDGYHHLVKANKKFTDTTLDYSNKYIENLYENIRLCNNCGADISDDNEKCHVCGEPINSDIENVVVNNHSTMAETKENICNSNFTDFNTPSNQKINNSNEINKSNEKKPIFCRICGAKLIEDSLFCSACGTKVEEAENAFGTQQ